MAKKGKNKRMRKRRWFTATERVEGVGSLAAGGVVPIDRTRAGTEGDRRFIVNWPCTGASVTQSRCRSSRALTLVEREEISRGIAAKESLRSIAVRLGRSPSTVSREVSRNGGL